MTSEYQFEKRFKSAGIAFSGLAAARRWLRERGYEFGTPQGSEPIAIMSGDGTEQGQIDPCGNFRTGGAIVRLKSAPVEIEAV